MATYIGGFTYQGTNGSTNVTGKASAYVAGGNLWPGDAVKLNGSVTVVGGMTYKQVVSAADNANEALVGVVIGKKIGVTTGGASPTLDTLTGSTAPIASGDLVYVIDDKNAIFSIPSSGSTIPAANLGLNGQINVATGSNGRSGMTLDGTYINAGTNAATAPIRVLDVVNSPDNDGVTTPFAIGTAFIVMINNHSYNSATGVAGV